MTKDNPNPARPKQDDRPAGQPRQHNEQPVEGKEVADFFQRLPSNFRWPKANDAAVAAAVEAIKAQIYASEETEKPKVNFDVGETIKINNGPFLNFSGVIEEIDPERGKLKVTVNIFGRNTPVELEYWQVEKA